MINWKCRFRNWTWVVSFLSQIMIVAEIVLTGLNTLGVVHFQLTDQMMNYVLGLANAMFILLSMLGIVQDPTTRGYADSDRALKYEKPK